MTNLFLVASTQAAGAGKANNPCAIPTDLRDEVIKRYPGTRIVSLADLDEYKRKLFKKDVGARCPGLTRVDFYGDGKPTWAIVLISGENPKRKAELIVTHKVATGWDIRSLDTTDGNPVVWSEAPGKYNDLYGKKMIRATRPVIVFSGLESFEVVFAWTGKEVERVQTSD